MSTAMKVAIAVPDEGLLQHQANLYQTRRKIEVLEGNKEKIIEQMQADCTHQAVVRRPLNFGYDSRDEGAQACLFCGLQEGGQPEVLSEENGARVVPFEDDVLAHLAYERAVEITMLSNLPKLVLEALDRHLAAIRDD